MSARSESMLAMLARVRGELAAEAAEQVKHGHPADWITSRLEGLGFETLGTGAHRRTFAHGERVLKYDFFGGGNRNLGEAAAYLKYPQVHPHVAEVTGVSDTGHFLAARRVRPDSSMMFPSEPHHYVSELFEDVGPQNVIAGKAIDIEFPKQWIPEDVAARSAATMGGTARIKETFSDVPGFGQLMDELQWGAMRGGPVRPPGIAHSTSVPNLPQGRAFGARHRLQRSHTLPS